jgi:hypothetical protein
MDISFCTLLNPVLESCSMIASNHAIVAPTSFLRLTSPAEKLCSSVGLRGKYQGHSEPISTGRPEQYSKEH